MAGLLSDRFEDLQYRGAILPFGRTKKGSTVFATPGLLVDAIKSMELPGRALRGENISADDVTQMAMDTMGGGGLLSRAVPTGDVGGLLGINVFHGGPNRWAPEPGFPQGRPRLDKVGTGESGQAYGHGFYSAEAPDVAKSYTPRDMDAEDAIMQRYKQAEAAGDYEAMSIWEDALMHETPSEIRARYADPDYDEMTRATANRVADELETIPTSSAFYKLDIPDADAAKFLDYDAPISGDLAKKLNEHPTVQRLNKEFETENFYKPDQTGGDVYADLARKLAGAKRPNEFNSKAASEIFRDLDIPGLKYYDQGSRGVIGGKTIDPLYKRLAETESRNSELREKIAAGDKGPGRDPYEMQLAKGEAEARNIQREIDQFNSTATRNYVTWDQDVLDRTKILERQ
jgi:hypothetical protein